MTCSSAAASSSSAPSWSPTAACSTWTSAPDRWNAALGLCTLKLHTASAGTNAEIPGLPAAEGARLREQLSARGEARLAGL